MGRTSKLLAACLCVSCWTGCSEVAASGADYRLLEDRLQGFWWSRTGEQSTVAVNFGPLAQSELGLVRRWTLVIHAPGAEFPFVSRDSFVLPEDDAPISIECSQYAVSLTPAEGRDWGSVESEEHLSAEVRGLY